MIPPWYQSAHTQPGNMFCSIASMSLWLHSCGHLQSMVRSVHVPLASTVMLNKANRLARFRSLSSSSEVTRSSELKPSFSISPLVSSSRTPAVLAAVDRPAKVDRKECTKLPHENDHIRSNRDRFGASKNNEPRLKGESTVKEKSTPRRGKRRESTSEDEANFNPDNDVSHSKAKKNNITLTTKDTRMSVKGAQTRADKTCFRCGRRITWRRKWATTWDSIKYCSHSCRSAGLTSTDHALEEALLNLLAKRPANCGVRPTEAERILDPEGMGGLREPARRAARRLVAAGKAVIVQRGTVVDPSTAKGPFEVRLL